MAGTRFPVSRSRRPLRSGDPQRAHGGQLLLLAGIILVLGFITTALTLNQIGNMEKQVAEEQQTPLLTEYRFFRNRVGTSLYDATTTSTDNATFEAIFESMSDTFRRMAQEKGYDLEIAVAAHGNGLNRTEWNYTSWGWPDRYRDGSNWVNDTAPDAWSPTYTTGPGWEAPADRVDPRHPVDGNHYWLWSHDDRVQLDPDVGVVPWDGANDGSVWVENCEANPGNPCIQAVVVYLRMADTDASIEEYVVYALNAT